MFHAITLTTKTGAQYCATIRARSANSASMKAEWIAYFLDQKLARNCSGDSVESWHIFHGQKIAGEYGAIVRVSRERMTGELMRHTGHIFNLLVQA